MVSIYILVWLRTWAYGKGSDNILQARKVWTSVGGAIKGVRSGRKEAFWEKVVTEGGSQRLPQQVLGAGRQRIIGQPSVDVAGSGWSEGKRMSARVTRKVCHPCRLWEFG